MDSPFLGMHTSLGAPVDLLHARLCTYFRRVPWAFRAPAVPGASLRSSGTGDAFGGVPWVPGVSCGCLGCRVRLLNAIEGMVLLLLFWR